MKLVFMGTPEFAVPSLEKLVASHHRVLAVVTRPDTEQGRGRRLCPSPVKVAASRCKLPILQPIHLTDSELLGQLTQLAPDLLVVVAFRILPEAVIGIPRFGAVNLHASLLPRYRGAAPIQWAIINGERETGLTTFLIDAGVDTGGILLQETVAIGEDETAGNLHDRMMVLGAELLAETVDRIERGAVRPIPQEGEAWPPAPKIRKENALIDWRSGALQIRNLVRGMNPAPGAYTHWRGEVLKVHRVDIVGQGAEVGGGGWRAEVVAGTNGAGLTIHDPAVATGTIVTVDPRLGVVVAVNSGEKLLLREVQLPGKRPVTSAEWVRGHGVRVGERFGGVG